MKSVEASVSGIARNLRTMARRRQVGVIEAAKRIMFLDGSVDAALNLLCEEYEREPNNQVLEALGDLYVVAGETVVAQAIFRSLHYENAQIHVTNLIHARIPATKALIDDTKKLLYIPIPKCGSSTVKNYFTSAMFGRTYGEAVHFQHGHLYRTITPDDIQTKYRDYFRFSVVRDPVSRFVSYYLTNVMGGSLRREAHQQDQFLGHPTRPGPRQFAFGFHQYRQLFKDFRHHTDLINCYLDPFRQQLGKVYQISELSELREKLSDIYGKHIDDERSMVSAENARFKSECDEAIRMHASWYESDLKNIT